MASGVWVAQAEGSADNKCWRQPQFLTLRENLAKEWSPRNGIERAHIDMMAPALSLPYRWTWFNEARRTVA